VLVFFAETLLKRPLRNVRKKDNIERDLGERVKAKTANIMSSGKLFGVVVVYRMRQDLSVCVGNLQSTKSRTKLCERPLFQQTVRNHEISIFVCTCLWVRKLRLVAERYVSSCSIYQSQVRLCLQVRTSRQMALFFTYAFVVT
jgi:hypothetical protein